MQQILMLFTLTSGAQVLGKITEKTLNQIQAGTTTIVDVTTALELRMAEGPQGVQVGMVPFGFPIIQNDPKRNFTTRFYIHALLTEPEAPAKQLADMYTQMTSSIQIASGMPNLNVVK